MLQMTRITTADFQFGNLLTDGEYTYTYDSANRLVGISKTDTSGSYAYNGNGDRLQETENGTTENYVLSLNKIRII
jgi:YD repeat-containing protein